MKSQKIEFTFNTCTEELPHEESEQISDHTRRKEINAFARELRLDLAKYDIIPQKVRREAVGLSTGGGMASIDIDVTVTADKEKLRTFLNSKEMSGKYFEDLTKNEFEEMLAENDLCPNEKVKKAALERTAEEQMERANRELKDVKPQIERLVKISPQAAALVKKELSQLLEAIPEPEQATADMDI